MNLFNFPCHALLAVEVDPEAPNDEQLWIELLDFWPDEASAQEAQYKAMANELQSERRAYSWYLPISYFIVPLSAVKSDCIIDLPDQLREAVKRSIQVAQ